MAQQDSTPLVPDALADYRYFDQFRISTMDQLPVIAGAICDDAWERTVHFTDLAWGRGVAASRRAWVWIGATTDHLCVAIRSELPPAPADLVAQVQLDTPDIVFDDSVEVWIDPEPDSPIGHTYQMLLNSLGRIAYQVHYHGDEQAEPRYGWKGDYQIAQAKHDGFWDVQMAIPVAKLAPGRLSVQGGWAINVCRNWKQPWAFSHLFYGEKYSARSRARFFFAPAPAHHDVGFALSLCHLNKLGRSIRSSLRVHNPNAEGVTVRTQLYLRRDKMPEVQIDRTYDLAADGAIDVPIECDDTVSDQFELYARVQDAGSKAVVFSRYLRWTEAGAPPWDIQQVPVSPVNFQFAYHPYSSRLILEARVDESLRKAGLRSLRFELLSSDQRVAEPLARIDISADELASGACRKETIVPPLNGTYRILCTPEGTNELPPPFAQTLERQTFEWEHNALGTSRKIYFPFEPLSITDRKVGVVLREYTFNELGLLDQVSAMSVERIAAQNIMVAPMRYTAVVASQVVRPIPQGDPVLTHHDDHVTVDAAFMLDSVHVKSRTTVELDGMLRVDLRIVAASGVDLDSLNCELPLSPEVARLMHGMIDGIRYPIWTSRVPSGEGLVWDAARLEPCVMPPNFCTYLWLGDANRGICFFAENDKGWGWDPKLPNVSLWREAVDGRQTVTLRVHLVNKRLHLVAGEERKLTFGLQASPVKPRLKDWRHRYWTSNYAIVGCDSHWFGLANCGSVYPANKDMSLWELVRRGNKQSMPDREVARAINYFNRYLQPYDDPATREEYAESIRCTLQQRTGKTLVFYYNRSSSPFLVEYQVFQDEWGCKLFQQHRSSKARHEVKIVPSDSYCDYAMWWYRKSFEVAGNTGIYIDNSYVVPSFNLYATAAYEREDGSIMPAAGIWGLRQLARRQFQLLNELKMYPWTMVHMTSAQILPANSFYTVQYDWERKSSEGDVHDRFSRDYILALSTGDHLGALPMVLHEQGDLIGDPWTSRTWMGVCLVHELTIDHFVWHHHVPPPNPIYELFRNPVIEICQEANVVVYRYWEERPQPATTEDGDLPLIVYCVPGREALVIVTNYGRSCESAILHLDLNALGFSGGCLAADVETGRVLDASSGRIEFSLGRHDLREFKLTHRAEASAEGFGLNDLF